MFEVNTLLNTVQNGYFIVVHDFILDRQEAILFVKQYFQCFTSPPLSRVTKNYLVVHNSVLISKNLTREL